MRSFIISIFLSISLLGYSLAHAADEILSSFELTPPDSITAQMVSLFFDLENRNGNTFEVIVPESQKNLFMLLAPMAKLIDADTAATAQARLRKFKNNFTTAGYHSFDQVQKWMKDLAQNHSSIAQYISYGTSGAGHPLTALRLKASTKTKPVLMLTAATHGDELITTEVLIRLVDKLVGGYGTDVRLTKIVNEHDIYFVPVLNVDGFIATRRFDGSADPNRSYPYPGHENVVPTPSIAGIINLFKTIRPVGSIDFHAYGELIMYPWAYTDTPLSEPYLAKFETIAMSMAAHNQYTYGSIADVIYIAPSSSADYYFWKSNSISLGIEIGRSKIPDPSKISAYVQSQEESTWKFIESF